MPAHNEEERIDRTLRAYRDACPQTGVRFLVALDSCTDRTPEVVRAHAGADDGAPPPRAPVARAGEGRHTDGAIASRRHPASMLPARRPLAREITSAGFAGSVRVLMGLPYRDTQCGAKVLRRHVVRDVLPRLASRDLLFDVDLLAAARDGGWRVVEVPTVWIHQEGSRVSAVSDSRRMGASLLRLWLRRRMRGRRHPLSRGVR